MMSQKHSDTRYKLLVFDWDGTLVDSIARIVSSLQTASRVILGEAVTETAARNVIGLGLREAIEQLHPQLDENRHTAVAEAYKQDYLYDNSIHAPLFEGVTELLEELKSSGFKLAIATGKSRIGLNHSLEEHRLAQHFITTRCAGEYRSKPHPEMLLGIIEDLDIAAENTLMIGDSEHDLLMAKNARVDSIAVSHGVHGADVLMMHQPLTCLNKITDLSAFLSHNNASA